MHRYEKIIMDDSTKKSDVIEILRILSGRDVSAAKEILCAAKFFVENNATFISEPAQMYIENLRE